MAALNPFANTKRLVVKIGSALLVDAASGHLNKDWLQSLCDDLAQIKPEGVDILIVSSGAIALGRTRLGLNKIGLSLAEKQACAATGQSLLTQAYEKALGQHNIVTAQALLTLNDTEDRRPWFNARSTLETLLDLGAIPIINENDTVATDEIRYGDNDRLAARTAQMIGADTLILLSDIDGLYSADPRVEQSARHIPEVFEMTQDILAMAGQANQDALVGSGGMVTKLAAAQIAGQAGCAMCIMNGQAPHPLRRLREGEKCTWFKPVQAPKDARRQWISGTLKPKGTCRIDDGAVSALARGKSLLVAGIKVLEGDFFKGDCIRVIGPDNTEIARGLAAYDSKNAQKIIGLKSHEIEPILGYDNGAALIHRDNMVMMTND